MHSNNFLLFHTASCQVTLSTLSYKSTLQDIKSVTFYFYYQHNTGYLTALKSGIFYGFQYTVWCKIKRNISFHFYPTCLICYAVHQSMINEIWNFPGWFVGVWLILLFISSMFLTVHIQCTTRLCATWYNDDKTVFTDTAVISFCGSSSISITVVPSMSRSVHGVEFLPDTLHAW